MSKTARCDYCNKNFASVSNRNHHQRTSKKCLDIQGKTVHSIYKCSSCNETFNHLHVLKTHENTCDKAKKKTNNLLQEARIKDLEKEVKRLHESLQAIASKATNIYKNCTINHIALSDKLAPYTLTPEKINQIVDEKFEAKHLSLKGKGLAKFAIDNVINNEEGKPQLVCTDVSRKTFIYRDENGNVYRDADATDFSDQYLGALEKKGRKIIEQIPNQETSSILNTVSGLSKIQDLRENRSPLTSELAKKLSVKTSIPSTN